MGGVKKEYQCVNLKDGGAGCAPLPAASGDRLLTALGACVCVFAACRRISTIAVVCPPQADDGEMAARGALPARFFSGAAGLPALVFVPGGASRRASVFRGLCALAGYAPEYVLVHDGARPWVSAALVDALLDEVPRAGAVIPVLGVVETPKELDGEARVGRHLKRASVVLAQTPQVFRYAELTRAHGLAAGECRAGGGDFTDDAEIWGKFSGAVGVLPGEKANVKITFPEDLPRGFSAESQKT
jgi:2-C-methyl-D-erythritol 4-phosphate cytidylyltransferase